MANVAAVDALTNAEASGRSSEGYLAVAWRRFRRKRAALAAFAVLATICLIALAAPLLSTYLIGYDPNKGRLFDQFQPPNREHWLGTDELGRDTLARLIHAGRVSLTIGFTVAFIQVTIGVSLGLLAGFYGRFVDDVINAVIQVLNNLPSLFILIMVSVLFRPGVLGLSILFGVLGWTGVARLVRARVLSERRRDYVDAALVAGAHDLRAMYRHILPNVTSVILVVAGFDVAGAILAEAGLSALGFGVRIPTASWGNMLSKSLENFNYWWLVVAPGAAISVTVFCLLLLADAIRDVLDPRLRS